MGGDLAGQRRRVESSTEMTPTTRRCDRDAGVEARLGRFPLTPDRDAAK
jgi:hypothetical protein